MYLNLSHMGVPSILMITNNCYLNHECPYWFFMNVFYWYQDPTSRLIQVNHFNFLKIIKIGASSNGNTEIKPNILQYKQHQVIRNRNEL